MASRKDIQAQIDALTQELESADPEEVEEVWISEGGREFKVTGSKAQKILSRWADLFADPETPEDETADADVQREDTEKPGKPGYFRKK
jgi:hypothetical protein